MKQLKTILGTYRQCYPKFNLLEWWETVISEPKFKRKVPMTVCIAAICNNTTIFGASDRMMTSGDIEFEPNLEIIPKIELPAPLHEHYNTNTKIYPVTNSIVILTAGDAALQCEIVQQVMIFIQKRPVKQETDWIGVKEAVDMYLEAYTQARAKRIQEKIYAPYGMTEKYFLENSAKIAPHLVTEITKQLQRFEQFFSDSHGIETIIAGVDATYGADAPSPHIYSIVKSANGDNVACCDSVGFAAVGSGGRHAEMQFMLAGHSPHSSSPETLLLTYLAKKRSEVAPGVGKGTDMFTIGPNLGSFAMLQNIKDFDMKTIETIYSEVDKGQDEVFSKGMKKTRDYIESF